MAEVKRRKPAASLPITSHPLFPVTVVLWFGALFGLASVAIRPALIEHAVLVTGIDRVIPMAAPPLGTTTRILLALMMTAIGCLIGLVVARRLAKPAPPATARHRRTTSAPATTDDGDSPVALFGAARQAEADVALDDEEEPESLPTTRRRQLSVIAHEERFDDHAPVPGASPILNVADLEIESFDAALEDDAWVRRSEPVQVETPAQAEPALGQDTQPDEPKPSNRLFEAYVRAGPGKPTAEAEVPTPGFELLPRDENIAGAASDAIAPAPAVHTIAADQEPPAAKNMTAAERIASAPLDALSHLELLERLALTIARRRATKAQSSESPLAGEPQAPVTPVVELPAALRAVPTAPDDDALPGYVPPRHIGRTDDQALAAGYSSLRGLTRPVLAESPENAESPTAQPVIAFPGTGELQDQQRPGPAAPRAFDAPGATSDRTEQALRAALATLQRMSGAA